MCKLTGAAALGAWGKWAAKRTELCSLPTPEASKQVREEATGGEARQYQP